MLDDSLESIWELGNIGSCSYPTTRWINIQQMLNSQRD